MCDGLWVDFDAIFSDFFKMDFSFRKIYIVLIFVARWRHNFREIAVKNCEKSKNRRKSSCAPLRFVEIAERFEENSIAVV